MFDYCGDITATLKDYESLLTIVIQETYPTGTFKVGIRQTKAMRHPKISVSIIEGPLCDDLVQAVPLLSGVSTGVRWAYRGKVLPYFGYRISANAKSTFPRYSKLVWNQMLKEDPMLRDCSPDWFGPPRNRPTTCAKHEQRLHDYVQAIHSSKQSLTMKQIDRGHTDNIEQVAIDQRRAELDRCTPQAADTNPEEVFPPRRVRL